MNKPTTNKVVERVFDFAVFNRCIRLFLGHAGFETAALNHETVDDTMENGVVVMSGTNVVQKVFNGFRCFFGIEFDLDLTDIGVKCDGHNIPYDEIENLPDAVVNKKYSLYSDR